MLGKLGGGNRQADFTFGGLLKGGGYILSRAWIYDGYYWRKIPDMPVTRDRPACSLVEMSNGERRILVAGGCETGGILGDFSLA